MPGQRSDPAEERLEVQPEVPGGFRSALRARGFRRLCAAHAGGTLAQQVVTFAVGVHVLETTGSGLWTSVIVASAFVPYLLLSPAAGVLADRRSRSAVLAWSSALRCLFAVALGTGLVLDWAAPVLVALAMGLAVSATPSYPALAGAAPQSVPPRDLPAAHAVVTCVENAAWIAGPGAFGLLLLFGLDPVAAVLGGAAVLALATVTAWRVRLPRPEREAEGSWWQDLVDGVRFVTREPRARRPMLLAVVNNFLYGYLVVALVLLVDSSAGPAARLGWFNAALTVGALTALVLVGRFLPRVEHTGALGVTLSVFAGSALLLGVTGAHPAAVALAALAGVTTLVAEVAAVGMLQRAVDAGGLARVIGLYDQLNVGAIALGSFLAGPLAVLFGAGVALALVAAGCLVAALALAVRRANPVPEPVTARIG